MAKPDRADPVRRALPGGVREAAPPSEPTRPMRIVSQIGIGSGPAPRAARGRR